MHNTEVTLHHDRDLSTIGIYLGPQTNATTPLTNFTRTYVPLSTFQPKKGRCEYMPSGKPEKMCNTRISNYNEIDKDIIVKKTHLNFEK